VTRWRSFWDSTPPRGVRDSCQCSPLLSGIGLLSCLANARCVKQVPCRGAKLLIANGKGSDGNLYRVASAPRNKLKNADAGADVCARPSGIASVAPLRGSRSGACLARGIITRNSVARSGVFCIASCLRRGYFALMRCSPGVVDEDRVIRILVVDDNPTVRRYLRNALEQHNGWRVCDEARNGQEAVDRFQQIRPDLIVLDFQMPYMNGLDAARIITQRSPEMPILMVTLYLSKQFSDEARRIGVRGACAKTDLSSLVDGVGALLRKETYFQN
jgi:two-component system chemotaxis response regulator CheY